MCFEMNNQIISYGFKGLILPTPLTRLRKPSYSISVYISKPQPPLLFNLYEWFPIKQGDINCKYIHPRRIESTNMLLNILPMYPILR